MVHEWALAESIVLYIKHQGYSSIKRLRVTIGVLQSIDKEILEYALKELASEHGIRVEQVELVEEYPLLKCNVCGFEWSISLSDMSEDVREAIHFVPEAIYAYYKCPRCGSVDYTLLKGRGVSEISVEPL
ncbi:MAG: hydrogenase nickel incorporation protein HypA [Desulfurococcaceae archaeon]|nr:hydrogenase nickel incorporation protein HypA [Desulfurococcaceae archaeon]